MPTKTQVRRVNGARGLDIVGYPGLRLSIQPTRDRRGLRITLILPGGKTQAVNRGRPPSRATRRLRARLQADRRRNRLRDRSHYARWIMKDGGLSRTAALQTVAREVRKLGAASARVREAPTGRPLSPTARKLRHRLEADVRLGELRSRAYYGLWLAERGVPEGMANQLLRREGVRIGGWPRASRAFGDDRSTSSLLPGNKGPASAPGKDFAAK
jgi:hypothetical protein